MKISKLLIALTTMLLPLFLSAKTFGSFNLKTVTGSNVIIEVTDKGFNFPQYPNKMVYLNFFGTQCGPCRIEIPNLIQEANNGGIQLISVQAQMPNATDSEVLAFKRELGMNYPVINVSSARDLIRFLSDNGRWSGGVPYTLMFDQAGNLLGPK